MVPTMMYGEKGTTVKITTQGASERHYTPDRTNISISMTTAHELGSVADVGVLVAALVQNGAYGIHVETTSLGAGAEHTSILAYSRDLGFDLSSLPSALPNGSTYDNFVSWSMSKSAHRKAVRHAIKRATQKALSSAQDITDFIGESGGYTVDDITVDDEKSLHVAGEPAPEESPVYPHIVRAHVAVTLHTT